ncbi:hypothetical protein [Pantoea ananatis]|uniref:hypothetical protein n=1 Tax=Pantoea ananas TaxID=553 RepID=UPI00048ED87D|nr:hypothetical protein [Pantoea ananatis]
MKGDKASLGRLEATAAYTEQLLEKAKVDMEEEYGADKWAAYHEKNQARLLDLIALLKSKNLEDGALVRLEGDDFTHMKNLTGASRKELIGNERINNN